MKFSMPAKRPFELLRLSSKNKSKRPNITAAVPVVSDGKDVRGLSTGIGLNNQA